MTAVYLSRLWLNPRSLDVIRDLGDVGHLHKTVMRAFPAVDTDAPRAALGVLFRSEFRESKPAVLVQSIAEPGWEELPSDYLREPAGVKNVTGIVDAIATGSRFRFLLVANPSEKQAAREEGRRNSRRVALIGDDARYQWLARVATRSGFELNGSGTHAGVSVDASRQPTYAIRGQRCSRIMVRAVRFEGLLRVTDADAMRRAWLTGIGPAKAYGCGLLSLGPPE